ncbi:MAG TPA: thiamine phosphate synthase, partial [Myxococcota bacterium]
MTTIFETAAVLAEQAHEGQRRRHGAPYIGHPRAVTAIAGDLAHVVGVPFGDADRAVAILHDAIEDNAAFTEASLSAQLGAEIAHRVQLLSKSGKGEAAVVAYYDRLRAEASTTTKLTKVADRLHNLSELHKDHDDSKLDEYVAETQRFVVPLADSIDEPLVRAGLRKALDDAIANARKNGDVAAGRVPGVAAGHGLYAIIQPSPTWTARLDGVLRGGAVRVQLRVKPGDGLTDRQWLAQLEEAATMAAAYGVVVVVNDRADLAFAARHHGHGNIGLHVGDSDLPPADARALLGASTTIGTSTHTVAQLLAVEADGAAHGGADHLALGPIHASPTKQGHAAVVGLDG